MTTRCAIWARVSTDEQESGNQLAELRQWAARRGFEIVTEYVLDESAWNGAHLGRLNEAIADARLVLRSSLDGFFRMGRCRRQLVAWGVRAVPKILRARPPHDDGEERKVRKLAGARHAPADWSERARIVALSWDGLGVPAIAERLGCHPKKVRRWLHRFSAEGIDGLGDRPGVGRKRRITEAERSAIIALARSAPPGRLVHDVTGELSADDERGPAQWTLDTLARAARDAGIEVGRSQVRRILLAEKVRWRRTRSWATSTDPEFAPKGPASWSSTPPRRRAPR